jgi:hypothetical protein
MIRTIDIRHYITTLLNEKGISLEHTFEIKSDGIFGNHCVPLPVLLEFIESLDRRLQDQIRLKLIRIDYNNGNVLHFLEYLTNMMIQTSEN